MRVAARSTAIGGEREAAVERVLTALAEAGEEGIDLLVLPELCLTGVSTDAAAARSAAEAFEERGLGDLAQAARDSGVSVVVGRYALRGGEVVNRAELLCAEGPRVPYDKIHRFDALGAKESEVVAAGEVAGGNLATTDLQGLAVGQLTCFDLRFPELAIGLAARGAQLLLAGAAWYAGPGKAEQLELVTRARAADCGAFIAVAAALGEGFAGESMVVGPDGQLLARGLLAVAEVEAQAAASQRERLPLDALRRLRP